MSLNWVRCLIMGCTLAIAIGCTDPVPEQPKKAELPAKPVLTIEDARRAMIDLLENAEVDRLGFKYSPTALAELRTCKPKGSNLNGISIDLRHQTYEVILFSNKFTKVYGVGDFICDNDRWRATPPKRQDTVCIRGPDRE